ncbi:hypothetical protein FKP32DRAFT_106657 [Trametes sanguinea]|nr:hypothetical protein FKP32DRAFT_106657 [Trametes sanguinea]
MLATLDSAARSACYRELTCRCRSWWLTVQAMGLGSSGQSTTYESSHAVWQTTASVDAEGQGCAWQHHAGRPSVAGRWAGETAKGQLGSTGVIIAVLTSTHPRLCHRCPLAVALVLATHTAVASVVVHGRANCCIRRRLAIRPSKRWMLPSSPLSSRLPCHRSLDIVSIGAVLLPHELFAALLMSLHAELRE